MTEMTAMAAEIRQAPEALARFFERHGETVARIGARMRALRPPVIVTCARGSSDNAAAYFKYLSEILAGTPVASIGPSVASLYGARLQLEGAVVVSVSQSGQSPDIVALQAAAKAAGAYAIAVVNVADSPLGLGADATLPLEAGPELSVAATKSFLSSAAVLAALVAEWTDDAGLRTATRALPDAFARALEVDWSDAVAEFARAKSAYVVGRGPGLPIAAEAALKLKETAMLHAEAFSGAEVMHGPLQLVEPGFPIIAFHPKDRAHPAMSETNARLKAIGASLYVVEDGPAAPGRLLCPPSGEPLLDPLAMLAAFYQFAEAVARARGHNPDRPTRLKKVTETL
ncbi:MAG: SIS domain-containing protein [Ancalomicrobiaceae bacterium]|nr:SIS domain-containing protein [Ancalomicrobiaceae bacterium]